MKIVFFGSDHFSLWALKACLASPHETVLAVTGPDRQRGRGLKVLSTVVRVYAGENKITVRAPADLKDLALADEISALAPDVYVVSSYGHYIPSAYLRVPRIVALNVHPSLLPKYRGSTPIQAALLNGDTETGVSVIEVVRAMDAGDIFLQRRAAVSGRENASTLSERLARLSYDLTLEALAQAASGSLTRTPQDESRASYVPKLGKEDGRIDFYMTAVEMDRRIRAFYPWPVCYGLWSGERVGVIEAVPEDGVVREAPGTLTEIREDGALKIAAREGYICFVRVQPAGKRVMSGADFARGRRLRPGAVFSEAAP